MCILDLKYHFTIVTILLSFYLEKYKTNEILVQCVPTWRHKNWNGCALLACWPLQVSPCEIIICIFNNAKQVNTFFCHKGVLFYFWSPLYQSCCLVTLGIIFFFFCGRWKGVWTRVLCRLVKQSAQRLFPWQLRVLGSIVWCLWICLVS